MDPRDLALWLGSRVPLSVANGFAWSLTWIWWFLIPIRRRETVERFERALPGVPARPALTRMFHDIVLGYFELLRWERERAEGVSPPSVTVEFDSAAIEPGSLLLSGHGGSWDLGLVATAAAMPTAAFLRTPANAWARDRLAEARDRHGLLALETGSTQSDAYAALEAGRSVFYVQDQRYRKGRPSLFFGQPAITSLGLAAAYLRTGRPIYQLWMVRLGVGRHVIHIVRWQPPALTGDKAQDMQIITDAVNVAYEELIRARPHGWWWMHRRWRGGDGS